MAAVESIPEAETSGVLQNRPFLFLWSAQVLSQTALNATIYILLVLVEEWTGSSTALGLLIFSYIIPSVIIGPAAGVFVDRWPKKTVLLATNLLRVVIVAGFALLINNFLLVLAVNLTFSAVSQFFAPAELAAIPAVVPRRQLIMANGLFNFTLSGAQLAGFVFVGPLLAKSFTSTTLFLLLSGTYGVCAILIALMQIEEPALVVRNSGRDRKEVGGYWLKLILEELKEGWRLLLRDASISLSVIHLTVVNSLVLIIGMLSPGYVSRVLGIRADDAVYVMAPSGVGMLLGVVLLPRLIARWPKELIATSGVFLTAFGLVMLGVVGLIGRFLIAVEFLTRVGSWSLPNATGPVLIVMGLALFLGLGYALVNVSAQTQVQERVPEELRGRVFATQLAFSNAAAILPLIFLGGLADIIGISAVALVAGAFVFGVATYSALQSRRVGPAVPE